MKYLTIGQMAKLNHISEQTLRLYDKLGLLSPCNRDPSSGYRFYDIKQSALLDIIQYMKALGMNLKDIKKQLDQKDIPSIKCTLNQRSSQIDEEIRQLKFQKRAIERSIDSLERYEKSPPDGIIMMEYIGKRLMYLIDSKINFYDYDIDTYETILRELKESLIADHLPQIYFCNAGSVLRYKNLIQRKFISTEVFVFVDKDFVPDKLTCEIPANNYLCIYCDDFNKEREYAQLLLNEISKSGYAICGDYICEVIAELPVVEKSRRGMFLRLQVPINFY